jgi:chaperonin cofactor prefoldin
MLGGEAFVDVSEDVATAHCEAEQEAVQAELDTLDERFGSMEARQKELKSVLYGRFGSQINLEE